MPSTPAVAIRLDGLTKSFGTVTAVDRLTLTVDAGEIFGLVGPDGAGKTTCLRMLAAIVSPTLGSAHVNGRHIVDEGDRLKHEIGYMSQKFGLYTDLTVLENLDFYADLYGVPSSARPAAYDRLLGFSRLLPFKDRRAGHLSGGMKQKLGLACALVHTPRVLLLDEPTNGIDPVSRRDFWRILTGLRREGVTILVSTAYLDEAERCHRLAMLHEGRLLALGTPAEMRALMPGTLLELVVPSARRAAAVLKPHFPAGRVNAFGDRIHLVTSDPGNDVRAAYDRLFGAGLPVREHREISPTLEDVFVALVTSNGREGSAAHAV
ncbi:MAG TPA: ABC transporter ATP-binding protein [Candidatus Ozemobacteraceae bacterium]|nr:ABC transporter ATP-binding protein [Candidatus Ozemobacteraceae bacterium]